MAHPVTALDPAPLSCLCARFDHPQLELGEERHQETECPRHWVSGVRKVALPLRDDSDVPLLRRLQQLRIRRG
jgi:hypothetical protein